MKKFIFIIVGAIFVAALAGCDLSQTGDKSNSEKYATEKRDEFGFREIKAGRDVILIVSVQEEYAITVEGEERLLKDVKTEVEGETLIVTTRGDISPAKKIRLKISMPELLSLQLWGASEASVKNVKSERLKIQAGGSSVLTIDGETRSLFIEATGAGKIDAEKLKTENAEVQATGSSEITVSVAGDLTAQALGASTVYYLGEPKNLKPAITGTGEVRKK